MEAIRPIVTVKNHRISITLPGDFTAEEVEVIILPKHNDFVLTDEMKKILDNRANEPTEDYLSPEQSLSRIKKKYGI